MKADLEKHFSSESSISKKNIKEERLWYIKLNSIPTINHWLFTRRGTTGMTGITVSIEMLLMIINVVVRLLLLLILFSHRWGTMWRGSAFHLNRRSSITRAFTTKNALLMMVVCSPILQRFTGWILRRSLVIVLVGDQRRHNVLLLLLLL